MATRPQSAPEALARLATEDDVNEPKSVEEAENELIFAWQTPDLYARRMRLAKATTALIRAVMREREKLEPQVVRTK